MKRFSIAFSLIGLALASSPAWADQLLTNGGFESGDFTGWMQSGNTNYTSVGSGNANSGYYAASLGPIGSTGSLSQTFSTAGASTLYLNFSLSSDGQTFNSFAVSLGNLNLQFSNIGQQNFTLYSYSTPVTGDSMTLTLTFQDDPSYLLLDDVSVTTSANDSTTWPIGVPPSSSTDPSDPSSGPTNLPSGSQADNTPSVTPEPSSLTLLGMGALGLLIKRRRRNEG